MAIVYIQKPFSRNQNISHFKFNLYWPFGTNHQKNIRVLTAVKKNIIMRVIVENQTGLICDFYYTVLDIKEFYLQSKKFLQKTIIVNLYDS